MKLLSSIHEMQRAADDLIRQGKRIGLVPTMGFLHEGHVSLMHVARGYADVVVTSVFVNPAQFGPSDDFSKYPRDLQRDARKAEEGGTDILFHPSVEEVYPEHYHTFVAVEDLTGVLEGKFRPTHFRGVTTIVAKLFLITKPHVAIFGQKDAQQALVITHMVKDLNFDLQVVVAPTIREADGLAMSSRNVYLSSSERQDATVLSHSLEHAERRIREGERNSSTIISEMTKLIMSKPSARIDYVSINDAATLRDVSLLATGMNILISLAVRIGTTRLIDNRMLIV